MLRKFISVLFAGVLLSSASATGRPPAGGSSDTIFYSGIGEKLKLDSVYVLETDCADCGLKDVLEQDAAFEKRPVSYPTRSSSVYWIRFRIVNDADSNNRLFLETAWNEQVEAYLLTSGKTSPQTARTGGFLPASERSIQLSPWMLDFYLSRAAAATVYIKVRNPVTTYPPRLSLVVWSGEAYIAYLDRVETSDNISIAFQGAVWVMLLFMLLVYFQNREKVYLYYSLYMGGMMVYLSTKVESNIYVNFLFREYPITDYYLNYPIQVLFYIAYNKFFSAFLDLEITDPWLHRSIVRLNKIFAAILLGTLLFQVVTGDLLVTGKIWSGISVCLVLIYLFLLYRLITMMKTPSARFLIAGMVIFMIAAVTCMLMVNFSAFRPEISPFNILEIGVFLEILCFSMGLGYKMWETTREKEAMQEAYIGELRRNESIIQEANLQLERKVRERSDEVIRKNKEIEEERKKQMASEYERKLAIAEMGALRAQMNPHFMFNSMSTLEAFILEKQEEEASSFLNKFSKLLRLVLENSRQLLVAVEKDIKALELYIQLEQIRYDHRFDYQVQLDPVLLEEGHQVPPLIIQPFVENAIVHGLFNKEGHGNLLVELSLRDNMIYCRVEDDGIGREKAMQIRKKNKPHHKSLGLKVTGERIETLNHIHGINTEILTTDLVDPEGGPAGTRVEIFLPLL